MAEEKMSMPSSFGGLVRYFDEYKSKLQLRPEYVILMIILVIVIEVLIRF